MLSDRDRASDFLVEDNKAYFIAEGSVNYGTRTVSLAGGASTAFANSVPGDPRGMAGDKGTELYIANVVDAIYRVPKNGSPAAKIPITGIPTTSSPGRLHVNSTWLVMSVLKYSGSVSCESSTWGIYAAPKSGGAAVLITSDIGFSAHGFAIDDDYVYWQAKPCTSGLPSVLRKRRLDGTGAAIDLAIGPRYDTMVGTDAQYLYWIDPITGMYRTPK